MTADAELEALAKTTFTKIQRHRLSLSYKPIHNVFLKKQVRFVERIEKSDLLESPTPNVKKTEIEKQVIKPVVHKRKRGTESKHEQQAPLEQNDSFYISQDIPLEAHPYDFSFPYLANCSRFLLSLVNAKIYVRSLSI